MRKVKRLLVLVFVLVNIYALLCGVIYFFQENLIFHPSVFPQDYVYQFDHEFEEIFLTSPDNAKLNGVHFKAKDSKGAILYFHGNAGDLARW